MPRKSSITMSRYIFLVSTNQEFRKRYLGKIEQLKKDFNVNKNVEAQISKLDSRKIKTQLEASTSALFEEHRLPNLASTHDNCHSHGDGDPGHSNTHCNYDASQIDQLVQNLGIATRLSNLTKKITPR